MLDRDRIVSQLHSGYTVTVAEEMASTNTALRPQGPENENHACAPSSFPLVIALLKLPEKASGCQI